MSDTSTKPPDVEETPKLDQQVMPDDQSGAAPASLTEMRRSNFITRVLIGAVGVFVAAGGFTSVVAAASLIRSEARAQAREEVRDQMKMVDRIDAGLNGIAGRVATLEQQVPQLRTEVYEGRVDTHEQRKDVRALQDVILSNRPSQRLTKPLPPLPAPPPEAP